MDGLEHALEHHGVQQREGHQGAAQQPLEARHPYVQQVNILIYIRGAKSLSTPVRAKLLTQHIPLMWW